MCTCITERFKRIEKENRILLEKMSKIMQGSQTLDNRLTQSNVPRSMNKSARRKDLERITNKNYQMLRRIQNKVPFYSHAKWEQEYKRHKQYMKNISYYKGKKGAKGSRSRRRLRPMDEEYQRMSQERLETYNDDDFEYSGMARGPGSTGNLAPLR